MKKRISRLLCLILALMMLTSAASAVSVQIRYLPCDFSYSSNDSSTYIKFTVSSGRPRNDLSILSDYDASGNSHEIVTRDKAYTPAAGAVIQNITVRVNGVSADSAEFIPCTATLLGSYGLNIRESGSTVTLHNGDDLASALPAGYNVLLYRKQVDSRYEFSVVLYFDSIPVSSTPGTTPGTSNTTNDPANDPDDSGDNECTSHQWEYTTQEPTCLEEGKSVRTCSVCGEEEVLNVTPKSDHTWEERTQAATVTTQGRTYRVCTVCGEEETLSTQSQKTHTGSGSTSLSKLSQEEIIQLLKDNPLALPDNIYDTAPSTSAPYATGKVKTSALQAACDRLNALRRIAGLPPVTLDTALCQNGQYGAVIMAANNQLSHSPSKPAGMDDSFYKQAYEACSSSNIYSGRILTYAVDGFMNDSDGGNIDRLGHRRWQLNPTMGKVGFGVAGRYCTEKVFDRSGQGCAYDYISWPASGNFPTELLDKDQAWSVSLNPDEYAAPSASAITITLSGGGKSWTFRGSDRYTAASSGKYFNVNNAGYGVNNCIIFRPDGVASYTGTYTVKIDGLRTKNGSTAPLEYTVDFFSLGGSESPSSSDNSANSNDNNSTNNNNSNTNNTTTNSSNPFTDVPSGAYYTDAVLWALNNNVTTGTTATTFAPYDTCTRGQVVTFLWRAMGQPEPTTRTNPFRDVKTTDYYYKAVLWAAENGITTGTSATAFSPSQTCTNGHVVTFLWRAEGEPAASGSSSLANSFSRSYYTDAVAWADTNGLLANAGAAFNPASQSPRANIVTYLYRDLAERKSQSSQQPATSVQPQQTTQTQQPTQSQQPASSGKLANGKDITDDNIREIIYALKTQYPEGMRWTNDNSYYSAAVRMTGYGCAGFALACSDAAFGSYPVSSKHSDFDSIKVGDMLRVNNDTHSVIVLEKRADSVVVAEGNYNSSIHWGREISRQELERGSFYAESRYPA